ARRLRVPRQLQILLCNVRGVAAYFDVGAIALVIAAQRIEVLASAIIVPAARPVLVVLLVRSHSLVSSLEQKYKAAGTGYLKATCAKSRREQSRSLPLGCAVEPLTVHRNRARGHSG